MPDRDSLLRLCQLCALVLGAALVAAPWFGHVDDTDTQLYQVVARHMAEDRSWLDPRYLPNVHPQFREHLPFGLWPSVAAIRLFGERALAPVAALWALGTIALVGWLGSRLAGRWAGLVAMLVLALTETFFTAAARPRLDGVLVLLSMGAAAPVLLPQPRRSSWLVAWALASLGALVKGPFGLVPLACASAARAWVDRSPGVLVRGAVTTLMAAVPAGLFLAFADESWREGYLRAQLLASAVATRTDGSTAFWFPFATVAGRFWPGLPLVALGLWRARREREARLLAAFCVLMLLALCLPGRKVWNHALVAYPGLALLAGAGTPVIANARRVLVGLAVVCVAAWVAAGLGLGRLLLSAPCVASAELAPEFDRLAPGEMILVVSSPPSWRTIASLAAERRLVPWLIEDPRTPGPPEARVALVEEPASIEGWQEVARARGWRLMRRPED